MSFGTYFYSKKKKRFLLFIVASYNTIYTFVKQLFKNKQSIL